MKHNKLTKLFIAAFALFALSSAVHAGTGGTEFQSLSDKFEEWVEGFGGKAISIATIGMGAFKSLAPGGSPIAILVGIGAAVLLAYRPDVAKSIFTATI
jgi:conjugal transfer pilus assembly protein TraA